MELADLGRGLLERGGRRGIDLGARLIDGALRDAERLDRDAVETLGELAQGGVTALAHPLDDVGRGGERLRVERARALELGVGELLTGSENYSTHAIHPPW